MLLMDDGLRGLPIHQHFSVIPAMAGIQDLNDQGGMPPCTYFSPAKVIV
jgi:hypothetical protein